MKNFGPVESSEILQVSRLIEGHSLNTFFEDVSPMSIFWSCEPNVGVVN